MSKILEHIIRKSLLTEQAVNFKTTRVLNKSGDDDELASIAMKQNNSDVIKNKETGEQPNIFMTDEDTEIFFNLKVSSTKKGISAIKGTTKYLKRQLAKMAGTLNLKPYINDPEFQIIVSSIPIKEKNRSVDYLIKIVYAGSEKFRLRGGTKSNTGTNIFTSSEYINALVTQKPLPKQSTTTNQNVSGTVGKSGATPASKPTTTSVDDKNFMSGKPAVGPSKKYQKDIETFQKLLIHFFQYNAKVTKLDFFTTSGKKVDGEMWSGGRTEQLLKIINKNLKITPLNQLTEKTIAGLLKNYPDKAKTYIVESTYKKHKMLSETTIARLAAQGYSVKTESDMIRLKQLIREQLQKSTLQEQDWDFTPVTDTKSDTKTNTKKDNTKTGIFAELPAGATATSDISSQDLQTVGVGMMSVKEKASGKHWTLNQFGKWINGYHYGIRPVEMIRAMGKSDAKNLKLYVNNTGYGELRDPKGELATQLDGKPIGAIQFRWHAPGTMTQGTPGSKNSKAFSVFFTKPWKGGTGVLSPVAAMGLDTTKAYLDKMSGSGPTLLKAVENAFLSEPKGTAQNSINYWGLAPLKFK